MIKPLTKNSLRFLSFLKEHLSGKATPTVREIMDGIGLSSVPQHCSKIPRCPGTQRVHQEAIQ